ncbi:hypothetical protein PTTG_28718 [Puccinia triticina 1-1 BBBD Race 1]|uniref:OTU domain-containing protein n=2 Tax=Puccinia triticina TaxID=208348 RepID=A0A180G9P4_PUCT1|nr:uncharacterized protein PtA15_13A431 [Puccinia triticina]OAV89344.1 hypothetical protein PTTG_28718 [Puccinia triticina 1-1 BBBD Race 1]WAQ91031.1 hypothetical protein PtA15_13A431 [Puccinia triticina]
MKIFNLHRPSNPVLYATLGDNPSIRDSSTNGLSNNIKKNRLEHVCNRSHSTAPPNRKHLIKKLPKAIQPHVEKMWDVRGDGHCGYRAAALGLGRSQDSFMEIRQKIVEEIKHRNEFYSHPGVLAHFTVQSLLNSIGTKSSCPCGRSHWLRAPDTFQIMANAFETPVIVYERGNSYVCFPHFCPPNDNPPIVIGKIPGINHVYSLKLKPDHNIPFPKGLQVWSQSASPEALAWELKYPPCLTEIAQEFQTYVPVPFFKKIINAAFSCVGTT